MLTLCSRTLVQQGYSNGEDLSSKFDGLTEAHLKLNEAISQDFAVCTEVLSAVPVVAQLLSIFHGHQATLVRLLSCWGAPKTWQASATVSPVLLHLCQAYQHHIRTVITGLESIRKRQQQHSMQKE
jgi:hypothetical protein